MTNKVILQTRTGKVINNFTDIGEKLAKVYESISKSIYFDGELYTDKISFNILNGLIKKKTIDAENKKNIDLVNYYIYDCFDLEHMDEFKQLLSEARHSAKNARLKTAAIQQAVKESRKK